MFGKLDKKFGGSIFKAKDGRVVPEDEWMVFLAQDDGVPSMLEWYLMECVRLGADELQIQAVTLLRERVLEWRAANPDRCKVADLGPGEKLLA